MHDFKFPNRFEETEESLIRRDWVDGTEQTELFRFFLKEEMLTDSTFLAEDVLVRHRFYCAGTAPADELIATKKQLKRELDSCFAGDILEIWILKRNPKYVYFICPDFQGRIPLKGAY